MQKEDLNYYEQRAEAEIEMAQRAQDSRAVKAHYELASIYLERIHGEEVPEQEGQLMTSP